MQHRTQDKPVHLCKECIAIHWTLLGQLTGCLRVHFSSYNNDTVTGGRNPRGLTKPLGDTGNGGRGRAFLV